MSTSIRFLLLVVAWFGLSLPVAATGEPAGEHAAAPPKVVNSHGDLNPASSKEVKNYIAMKEDLDMWPFGPLVTLESGANRNIRADTFLRYSVAIEDLSKVKEKDGATVISMVLPDLNLIKMDHEFGFDFWLSKIILLFIGMAATVSYNRVRREQKPSKVRKIKQGSSLRKEGVSRPKKDEGTGKVLFMPKAVGAGDDKDSA